MWRLLNNQARILLYFAMWVVLTPFLASVAWLLLDRLSTSSQGFAGSLGDALFAAPFGVVFSMIITVPLSLILFTVSRVLRDAFVRPAFVGTMVSMLIAIGLLWALFIVRDSGFSGNHLRTVLVGALAGLLTGVFSAMLLRKPTRNHAIH